MDSSPSSQAASRHQIDSPYAAIRLFITLILMIVGASGMYVVAVVLPEVQADFGVARGMASLPYTLTMLGVGVGGVLMGRLADKAGITVPLMLGGACLGGGFVAAALAPNIWVFMAAHCILIGLLGTSATFSPLVADTSLWFLKRRGIAVAVCASGNYLGGAIWPPIVQHFVGAVGWRQTYIGLGIICAVVMCSLALLMRARPPALAAGAHAARAGAGNRPFGLATGQAQLLLCVAGVACCVAMAMPQVHIVAYCGDLGYGPARGAQMLSLMLACGVVSRLVSGAICDRIGGLRTLLLGSVLQCLSLLLFLPFDGLASLYVISALFGLFQGGIVPSYAIIVREYFPAAEAGQRVGTVIMCTMFGMALGGWMSGKIFDLTGSYHAAFANGIGWNLVNLSIACLLLMRVRGVRLKTA
ncbi:putative MFS family arabinose efflux permease [Herbaspirillum sp. SJZ130]|nr:MFS family permease [Herbaspirillum sp. SJZ102]TQK09345.1 putative MFS family arabinose efflux permease [Herbaspirillum sp. SJZ130]TQK13968.1 putative MFS family arabinose efflux permease [Herbaspirillum sp. SJZ106]